MNDHSMNQGHCGQTAKSWYAFSDMPPSSCGVVRDLHGDACFVTMLATRGLTAGTELSKVRNSGHGALLILLHDTCLALSQSEAAWIEVELSAAGE
jgi:Fe2+ transport system protein FeoA